MKGLLKIYHPDETLKYHIQNTYCKAVYNNSLNTLEVEIITSDTLDHVDDDSLQYNFPQLSLKVSDFPINSDELQNQSFKIEDNDEDQYTEVDLHDDEEAFLYENELSFELNEKGELQLFWQGEIDDFYTKGDEPIPFKLKCHFKQDDIEVDE
ncbi:hypothetical protein [Chryseobacterium sp. POL2]|uniref:hypothetical protein n=1 Tax=Chryseobacterium sp. POL2 TaxID=2713414 RepID=UPI0013E1CC4C|nr:hypothetical protein [Chryseobacterium sp. POL2]QIG89889.1 hypothetical protein G6R40_09530 [Chryseobacterium sp. POL2]